MATRAEFGDAHGAQSVDSDGIASPRDDEEVEEEEEEPRLKYQRLGGSLPDLLSSPTQAASCLAVSDKLLVLGTRAGTVHLLDVKGYQVKRLQKHEASVVDVCCDRKGEYVASCAADGSVWVQSLYTDESARFEYNGPLSAIALDPEYASKASRRFVVGGEAGKLWMNNRGWLGTRDTVLHHGEGPVQNIEWCGNFIAWANNVGVKVFDSSTSQRVGFVDLPDNSLHPELYRPQIVWNTPNTLIVAWPHAVKVAKLRTVNDRLAPGGGSVLRPSGIQVALEIAASFTTDYHIAGVAPFEKDYLLLAHVAGQQGTGSERPEIRIVSSLNWEISSDALPIRGYEHNVASDYQLASWQPSQSWATDDKGHVLNGQASKTRGLYTAENEQESLYFIVSPKDIVQARKTDVEDNIAWLVSHEKFAEALRMAEEAGERIRKSTIDSTWDLYLQSFLESEDYEGAAKMCSRLLGDNAAAWERCVFEFAHRRKLPILVPYVPTEQPKLRSGVYEMVLKSLIARPEQHKTLLFCIQSWPKSTYSQAEITYVLEEEIQQEERDSIELKGALAELYMLMGMKEKVFYLFLELKRTQVFDFVEQNGLYSLAAKNVKPLFSVDANKAMKWLVDHASELPPSEVVPQMSEKSASVDAQRTLLQYLHKLYQTGLAAAAEFADLQVRLYAEFDREHLMPFLVGSHHYHLDTALKTCKHFRCVRENVYILNRMGNPEAALSMILNHIEDEMSIEDALEFVKEQRDRGLWEFLIEHSLQSPTLVSQLLDHVGGVEAVDPLQLLERIPPGMHIPHLRDKVIRIIADYRTQLTLCSGASQVLRRDCVALSARYLTQAQVGMHVGARYFQEEAVTFLHCNMKCSICLGPLCKKDVVIFFCTHGYHSDCLSEFTSSGEHSASQKACIVCNATMGRSR